MLTILISTLTLIPSIWLTSANWLWAASFFHSTLIALFSLTWLKNPLELNWAYLNPFMGIDPLSAPLLALTCWLLPLIIIASQNHINPEPIIRQRIFLTLMTTLQALLILAFSATELLLFYVAFEATLIPTLCLITRWGNQAERLNAGTYFLFYTLAGSLPLLVTLLIQYNSGTLSILSSLFTFTECPLLHSKILWSAGCLLAFLVKIPLYGVHLWLPKAHVEAPIAGSIILAAVLLKLGGYGLIRIMPLLESISEYLTFPFVSLALWGIAITSLNCLRQTDLKSLIAYSSVSHMGLVVAAIFIQTPWSLAGALILIIAHGLTSSALFCLANTVYERSHTRTMALTGGLQILLPLMAFWWFIASLANLAFPPFPNLIGELTIIIALFNWSWFTLIMTGAATLITAAYSLYMFIISQWGPLNSYLFTLDPSHTREHLLLALHIIPLILLILKPEIIQGPITCRYSLTKTLDCDSKDRS